MDRIELGLAPAPEGGILSVIDIQAMPEGLLAFQKAITAPVDLVGAVTEVDVHAYLAPTGGTSNYWAGGEKTFDDLERAKAYAFTAYFGIEQSLLPIAGAPDLALVREVFEAREGRTIEATIAKMLKVEAIAGPDVTSGLRAIGIADQFAHTSIVGEAVIMAPAAVVVDGARGVKGDPDALRTVTGTPVSAGLIGDPLEGPYAVYVTPKPAVFRTEITLVEGPNLKGNRTNYLAEATYVIVVAPENSYMLEATINA